MAILSNSELASDIESYITLQEKCIAADSACIGSSVFLGSQLIHHSGLPSIGCATGALLCAKASARWIKVHKRMNFHLSGTAEKIRMPHDMTKRENFIQLLTTAREQLDGNDKKRIAHAGASARLGALIERTVVSSCVFAGIGLFFSVGGKDYEDILSDWCFSVLATSAVSTIEHFIEKAMEDYITKEG